MPESEVIFIDNSIETIIAELEGRDAELSDSQRARLAVIGARLGVGDVFGKKTQVDVKISFARFEAEYMRLPKANILAKGSTWKTVLARISDPAHADKMRQVEAEGMRLYAVLENHELEFMDADSERPPMFLKDKARHLKDGSLQVIKSRNAEEMDTARNQIEAGTHNWATIQEMLDWAAKNNFGVFEADTNNRRLFGELMELAEKASRTNRFVGKAGGTWVATALKDARYALFSQGGDLVYLDGPSPGARTDILGLIRRLRI